MKTKIINNLHCKKLLIYLALIIFGVIFVYPFLFLVSATFKSNEEVMTSLNLIPGSVKFDAYINGWKGVGQYSFNLFFMNSFKLVIPVVAFTICSSILVAYGFARFQFKGNRILFLILLSTLMLPNAILVIPKYILFRQLNWLDSYLPFIVPSIFATHPFFIFAMVQFFRGIPRELDESAMIDGSGSFSTLVRILVPLLKPAIFSTAIFQFLWTWNDFFNSLIYINSVKNYTVMLGLRMAIDTQSGINWSQVMATSLLSMLPPILLFFFCQRYFIEGIATTGLKG